MRKPAVATGCGGQVVAWLMTPPSHLDGSEVEEKRNAPPPIMARRCIGGQAFRDGELMQRLRHETCGFEGLEVRLEGVMDAREGHPQAVALNLVRVLVRVQVGAFDHERRSWIETFELPRRVDWMNDCHTEAASWDQDSANFPDRPRHVINILQGHISDNQVAAPACQGHRGRVGHERGYLWGRGDRSVDHGSGGIDPDDSVAKSRQVPRYSALAAADVEGQMAGRRQQSKERGSPEPPVRVMHGRSSPSRPRLGLLFPRRPQIHWFSPRGSHGI